MLYRELQDELRDHNWDDGFETPRQLLDDPNCDLALALEIFYFGDGCACLCGRAESTGLSEWKEFILSLYDGIRKGRYPRTGSKFQVPLSKVEKYRFRKQNVPDVFLDDL